MIKPLSRKEPSETRRYAYLDELRNRLSNGVMFNIVARTDSIIGTKIESIPSRHERSLERREIHILLWIHLYNSRLQVYLTRIYYKLGCRFSNPTRNEVPP